MYTPKIIFLSLVLGGLFFSCAKSVSEKNEPAAKAVKTEVPKAVATAVADAAPVHTSPVGKRSADEMVAAGFRRYGVEKGTLLFRLEGAVKGMDALYFDRWGWQEGKHQLSEAEVGAFHKSYGSVQYLNGERRYQYEPKKDTAYFFESTQIQAAADKYGTLDMTIVTDEMIRNMGGEKVGEADVVGVQCDVWKIERTKTTLYQWRGITLKEVSFTNNLPVTRRCILLDTTVAPDLAKMVLPESAVLENVGY